MELTLLYFAIRSDASVEIGSGHVMRCLCLATALRDKGHEVAFFCLPLEGNLISLIKSNGFDVHTLPDIRDKRVILKHLADRASSKTWLIVDHYGLDAKWESDFSSIGTKILVIDDLANREHRCEFLLDQNLQENPAARYEGLIQRPCRLLLGPRYALLRSEFSVKAPYRNGTIRNALVTYGGVDSTNETEKALDALEEFGNRLRVDVVIGKQNARIKDLEMKTLKFSDAHLHIQTAEMANLMRAADICLGAGGSTHWERCALGLPTIVTAVAENQISISQSLHKAGAIIYLGYFNSVSSEHIRNAITQIFSDEEAVRQMANRSLSIMSDHVGTEGLIQMLEGY